MRSQRLFDLPPDAYVVLKSGGDDKGIDLLGISSPDSIMAAAADTIVTVDLPRSTTTIVTTD